MKNLFDKISFKLELFFTSRAIDKRAKPKDWGLDESNIPCSMCSSEVVELNCKSKLGLPVCIECSAIDHSGFFTKYWFYRSYKRSLRNLEIIKKLREKQKSDSYEK
jgi:hypothetical protein